MKKIFFPMVFVSMFALSAGADGSRAEAKSPKEPHKDFQNYVHNNWEDYQEKMGENVLRGCKGQEMPSVSPEQESAKISMSIESMVQDNAILEWNVDSIRNKKEVWTEAEAKVTFKAYTDNAYRCFFLPQIKTMVHVYEESSGLVCERFSESYFEQAEKQCALLLQLATESQLETMQWYQYMKKNAQSPAKGI